MIDLLFVPLTLIYFLIVCLLFIYGINFYYLSYVAWRQRPNTLEVPELETLPRVTVQLPIYNELYVASRLIQAAAQLDYPAELLEIQVLDDSDDETQEIARQLVTKLQDQGVDIHYIHRDERKGYKAGALARGFELAKGEFLAIFDADFIPPPDFLRRTLPHFRQPEVGFIQARWGHVNRDYSLLTHLQSLAIDAHFMVEQFARSRSGYWFNFNGTAGIWRRKTIEDAGGWKAETLTEDLDLSYRAFFKGWQAVYLHDLEVPAELPVNFSAFRRQQQRWARGSLECARKYLPQVWNTPSQTRVKIQASLHLSGYCVHLLLFALDVLYPVVLLFSQRYSNLIALFGIAFLFNATALAPTTFFAVAQHQLGKRWWKELPAILFITAAGSGMMVNTVRAAFQAFGNHPAVFDRTPKFGIREKREGWMQRRYQLKFDPIVFSELFLVALNATTVVMALQEGNWIIAVYAAIFGVGLSYTAGMTIIQSLAIFWQRNRPTIRSNRMGKAV